MELFQTSVCFLQLNGVIYFWGILSLLTAGIVPNLAGVVFDKGARDSTVPMTEASGHGSLLDILGFPDEDADDDYNDGLGDFEDGRGRANVGGSAVKTDVRTDDSTSSLENLAVKCFRCHGDGINGCDVLAMMEDPQTYSVTCFGKCLNLSSGSMSVYDCAHDMMASSDTCLKNGDTEMCFCTGDFCNSPSEDQQSYIRRKTPFLFHSQQLGKTDDSLDADIYDKNHRIFHLGLKYPDTLNSTTNTSKNERSSRKNYKNVNKITENKEPKVVDNLSRPLQEQLFSETSTDFAQASYPNVPDVQQTEVDVLISESSSRVSDNFTSQEVATSTALDISELRIGKLKERTEKNSTGGGCMTPPVSGGVLLSVCSMLLALRTL